MITATWCEKRALSVGMPRRSTEWSTESSCTRVARWINSTTAASVTARGSTEPAAWLESSSSVGRNSFPFMRTRCSFTSAIIGKSAAMIRRSSSATRSSSPATGRWRSRRATGTTCWVTLLRLGERLGARAHVPESNVHGEHPAVQLARLDPLTLFLEGAAQPVQDAQALLVATSGRPVERAPQDRLRHDVGALVDEAHAQRLRASQLPVGRPQRLLQLRNRLVQEPYFLEGHAQVVVRLEVALIDVLVDPLFEARQHLLKVPLLVPGRLFVSDFHARVAHRKILFENHRAQVYEVPRLHRLVPHLHLRVPSGGLSLRVPDFRFRLERRLGRRRGHRREHRERSLGALVGGIVLGDALVDGPRLVGKVAPQQRVGQLEVCVDQLRLVARLERELDLFLPVPHAVGIEPQDLVHEILRLRQVPSGLEAGRRQVQLLDAPLPLARFDQRLAQRLVPFGIIRVIGDPPLELLDRGLRRRRVAVAEPERSGFLLLAYQAVQAQVDRSRTAPAPPPPPPPGRPSSIAPGWVAISIAWAGAPVSTAGKR